MAMNREMTPENFERYCELNPIEKITSTSFEINFHFKNGHHVFAHPDEDAVMNYKFVTEIGAEDFAPFSDDVF